MERIWKRLIVIACIFVVLGSSTITLSKYIGQTQNNFVQIAEDFYFSSNLVKNTPSIQLYGGGNHTVVFDVKNYEDDLRITENDIAYSISSSTNNGYSNYSFNREGAVISGGSLIGMTCSTDSITMDIVSGYNDNTQITVNINSTSPYKKTLTFVVHLHDTITDSYLITDSVNSPTAVIKILVNNQINADVLILNWDYTELEIDSTNNYVNSAIQTRTNGSISEISFDAISANSVLTITFFKVHINLNYSKPLTSIVGNSITIQGQVA